MRIIDLLKKESIALGVSATDKEAAFVIGSVVTAVLLGVLKKDIAE